MSLFSVQIYKRKGLLTSSVSHVLPAIGVHTFSGRASFVHEIAAESEIVNYVPITVYIPHLQAHKTGGRKIPD